MLLGLGDILGLSALTIATGVGLYAGVLAGGLSGDPTIIPFVVCSLCLLADGAGVLVLVIVQLGPAAVLVIGSRIGRNGAGGGANAAGLLDLTTFLTGSFLNYLVAAPGVVLFLYAAANRAGLAVLFVVHLGPDAIFVVAGNGDGYTTCRAGNSFIYAVDAHR